MRSSSRKGPRFTTSIPTGVQCGVGEIPHSPDLGEEVNDPSTGGRVGTEGSSVSEDYVFRKDRHTTRGEGETEKFE